MKMMKIWTKLRKHWISAMWNICGTEQKLKFMYITISITNPRILLVWDTYWKSTKLLCRIAATILWSSLNWAIKILKKPKKSLPFGKHFNDIHSIPLLREHHDSCRFYEHYKTCEKIFAVVACTVVSDSVKNINTGIFS